MVVLQRTLALQHTTVSVIVVWWCVCVRALGQTHAQAAGQAVANLGLLCGFLNQKRTTSSSLHLWFRNWNRVRTKTPGAAVFGYRNNQIIILVRTLKGTAHRK